MSNWISSSPEFFFKSDDPNDQRLGNLTQSHHSAPVKFTLLGYPEDEGVKINGGRLGASLGPDQIRKSLYRMTPSWTQNNFSIEDLGNISHPKEISIIEKQLALRELLKIEYLKPSLKISLGGGHDFAYPDAAAFIEHSISKGLRPLVVNFDAHLDVRPLKNNLPHSGSAFFQLLNEFQGQFDFVEIGIQDQCNSVSHKEWAKENGALVWSLKEALLQKTSSLVPFSSKTPLFLSVDIDVFSSALAPGCSASWPQGLNLEKFFEHLDYLLKNFQLKGVGVYEVAPPLDTQNLTSKLSALIIYEIMKRIS